MTKLYQNKEWLLKQRMAGKEVPEIARECGASQATVYNYLRKAEIKPRKAEIKPKKKRPLSLVHVFLRDLLEFSNDYGKLNYGQIGRFIKEWRRVV